MSVGMSFQLMWLASNLDSHLVRILLVFTLSSVGRCCWEFESRPERVLQQLRHRCAEIIGPYVYEGSIPTVCSRSDLVSSGPRPWSQAETFEVPIHYRWLRVERDDQKVVVYVLGRLNIGRTRSCQESWRRELLGKPRITGRDIHGQSTSWAGRAIVFKVEQ